MSRAEATGSEHSGYPHPPPCTSAELNRPASKAPTRDGGLLSGQDRKKSDFLFRLFCKCYAAAIINRMKREWIDLELTKALKLETKSFSDRFESTFGTAE
jgi:hypothetical protein